MKMIDENSEDLQVEEKQKKAHLDGKLQSSRTFKVLRIDCP